MKWSTLPVAPSDAHRHDLAVEGPGGESRRTQDRASKDRSHDRASQRGSGSALAASMVVLIAVTAFWVALFSAWVGSSHTARSSADLAAIAAAHAHLRGFEGCDEARRVATANGAELLSCELATGSADFVVELTVSVPLALRVPGGPGSLQASATAGAAATAGG